MKIKNKRTLDLLKSWQEKDWNIDLHSTQCISERQPPWDINEYDYISEMSTSDEYIHKILNKEIEPRYYSVTTQFGEEPYGRYIFQNLPIDYDIYYTTAYAPNGFVGWHTDSHKSGWYMLFSYTEKGDGFFKFIDPITKQLKCYDDQPGWNFRNYYAGNTEDTILWHCALAKSQRLTFILFFHTEEKYQRALKVLTNP